MDNSLKLSSSWKYVAFNNRLNLFTLKHFQLAIIDEASQILEPDLIGILSALFPFLY